MSVQGQITLKSYLPWFGLPCSDYTELIQMIYKRMKTGRKLPPPGGQTWEKFLPQPVQFLLVVGTWADGSFQHC